MATHSATDILFEPVTIGKVTIPNRIAMAPMTREFAPGGLPGQNVADYYRKRAEGGTGLIITEGMAVNMAGSHDGPIPFLFHPGAKDANAQIVKAVHGAGAKIMPQLWHVGTFNTPTKLKDDSVKAGIRRVGPSGISGHGDVVGDTLDEKGIADTIADFVRAAAVAKAAGYDGVEVHGAHGYLPDQFLWPRTNKREDRYGGPVENRTRFLVELARAIKAEVGSDFPLLWRFSQWKTAQYDARLAETPEELAALFQPLVDAGVDCLHCSTRRFWEPGFAGSDMTLAGWTRKLTGVPVIGVGSVTLASDFKEGTTEKTGGIAESGARTKDVDDVARLIEKGEFDIIAVGRALISNPAWANLVREGRTDELKPFTKAHLATLD